MRLPPAVLSGNTEVVSNDLVLLNVFVWIWSGIQSRWETLSTSHLLTLNTRRSSVELHLTCVHSYLVWMSSLTSDLTVITLLLDKLLQEPTHSLRRESVTMQIIGIEDVWTSRIVPQSLSSPVCLIWSPLFCTPSPMKLCFTTIFI